MTNSTVTEQQLLDFGFSGPCHNSTVMQVRRYIFVISNRDGVILILIIRPKVETGSTTGLTEIRRLFK